MALERKTFSIFHIRCPVSTMSNYVLLLVISYKREKAFQLLCYYWYWECGEKIRVTSAILEFP